MSKRRKAGFTLIELLVVVAIIGVLIALLLPAVQSAREASRRINCQNNLRQMALAATNYHDVKKYYPPARLVGRLSDPRSERCADDQPSWFVHIMPFMEQDNLYDKFSLFESVERDLETKAAMNHVVPMFVCTTRRSLEWAVGPESFVETRTP